MDAIKLVASLSFLVAALFLLYFGLTRGDPLALFFEAFFEKKDKTLRVVTGPSTGREGLIGCRVEVLSAFEPRLGQFEGWVAVGGERWHARSVSPARPGEEATVTAIEGLTLHVDRDSGE